MEIVGAGTQNLSQVGQRSSGTVSWVCVMWGSPWKGVVQPSGIVGRVIISCYFKRHIEGCLVSTAEASFQVGVSQ